MNKTNIMLSIVFAFTIINNSFGMLTKAKQQLNTYKNVKASVHTKQPQYVCSFNVGEQEDLLHKIIQQNKEHNNLVKENNSLLKENNAFLSTIVKQNYVYASYKRKFANRKAFQDDLKIWRKHYTDSSIKRHEDLLEHYYTLKQQYGIDVTHELE